ncbi:hypothetical protein [Pseudozobellia sp. WGM2]|uniref:hypothetical protein n=1 Tax=Pseudozobellia sp. WGM2 TaxID=2787625 RepID=UPI001AE03F48|nr:hypothetical protein [Pseudozobellia sp. WGM2]
MKLFQFSLLLIAIGSSCTSHKKVSESANDIDINMIMQQTRIENQIGVLDFIKDIGKFAISFHQENTIDSQYTCIVPEASMIPAELKPGAKVIFTGLLSKDPSLPPPRIGGEQVFLLARLESIRLFINN